MFLLVVEIGVEVFLGSGDREFWMAWMFPSGDLWRLFASLVGYGVLKLALDKPTF